MPFIGTFNLFVLLQLVTVSLCDVDTLYHPENDCKRKTSLCYDGPKFDNNNQYKSCASSGVIALTFDNAPSNYTSDILDVLKAYKVRATFFLKGNNILTYQNLAQRIIDEGHAVGCSTFDLPILTEITSDKFNENLDAFESALKTLDLKKNFKKYFRAPRGFLTDDVSIVLDNRGYIPIQWSLRSGDVYASNLSDILKTLSAYLDGSTVDAHKISVILQMDAENAITGSKFASIISYLMNGLGRKGVRFVGVDDCILHKK